jgi:two-component system CheB/CheR fusion protein
MVEQGDVASAIAAMKAGAADVVENTADWQSLLARVDYVIADARARRAVSAGHDAAVKRIAALTPRQRQVLDLVIAGRANKNIAADLGISQRSVENHRAAIMKRTGAKCLAALARLTLAAAGSGSSAERQGAHPAKKAGFDVRSQFDAGGV